MEMQSTAVGLDPGTLWIHKGQIDSVQRMFKKLDHRLELAFVCIALLIDRILNGQRSQFLSEMERECISVLLPGDFSVLVIVRLGYQGIEYLVENFRWQG